jgi:phospholipid-binding lipoprotein MlaA
MVIRKNFQKLVIFLFLLANPVFAMTAVNPKDPYERFNRLVFAFNDVIDNAILQPLAKLYNKIVPKPLNKRISNFYNNIDTVPTVLNDVLQANFYQATSDAWRLIINSTAGILGFFDIGSEIGLEPNTEDFGLTLAQWGYKNSNYLVLPFIGPTTFRDGIGFFINYQYLTIYPYIYPVNERYRLYFLGLVQRRADLAHFQNVMDEAALDKYVFMRDAYMQRRNYLIERNQELSNPYMNKNDKADKAEKSDDEAT